MYNFQKESRITLVALGLNADDPNSNDSNYTMTTECI